MLIPINEARRTSRHRQAAAQCEVCDRAEEEIGERPSRAPSLLRNKDRLRPISCSRPTARCGPGRAVDTVANRGLASLEFTGTGAAKDLHSGRHGGGFTNPLARIAVSPATRA